MKIKGVTSKKTKQPWPTKDAMEQIYKMHLWGGAITFYSGEGSHKAEYVKPYLDVVCSFLKSFSDPPIVCDLGCGDFNVGKELVKYTKKYVAVDIVPELIAYNKKTFKESNLEFHCLDIAVDEFPEGDCVILRQVLQHLSNVEVHAILKKLEKYKYIILTEHLPEGDFTPNEDIISGQGIRLKKHSGVDIAKPPFSFKAKSVKQLVAIPLLEGNGIIVTNLYQVF